MINDSTVLISLREFCTKHGKSYGYAVSHEIGEMLQDNQDARRSVAPGTRLRVWEIASDAPWPTISRAAYKARTSKTVK